MQSRFANTYASATQSDYDKSTSSFFGSILTTTTTKYNTLKRQLISSEADGDTEDDSHIARGLRAYYTEKGRGLPEWLPKDPKAPVMQAPAVMVSSSGSTPVGGGMGHLMLHPSAAAGQQPGWLGSPPLEHPAPAPQGPLREVERPSSPGQQDGQLRAHLCRSGCAMRSSIADIARKERQPPKVRGG